MLGRTSPARAQRVRDAARTYFTDEEIARGRIRGRMRFLAGLPGVEFVREPVDDAPQIVDCYVELRAVLNTPLAADHVQHCPLSVILSRRRTAISWRCRDSRC